MEMEADHALAVLSHHVSSPQEESLARYGIGRRPSLAGTTPEVLAAAIRDEYGRATTSCALPTDGAGKAAEHILSALDGDVGCLPA
jgi:hypothetical protein